MQASIQPGSTEVEDFTCIIKCVESIDRIVKVLKERIMPLKIFQLILFTSKLCFPNVLASIQPGSTKVEDFTCLSKRVE